MAAAFLALCDPEKRFLQGFTDYCMMQGGDVPEIQVFSDVDALCSFAGDNRVDVLLIANECMNDGIKELDIGKIIILSDGEIKKEYRDYPVIFKYQSSDRILTELLNYCADNVSENPGSLRYKRDMKIIGVYSPVKRVGKTSLALALGQILGANAKVLYVNMEEYSGLAGVLDGGFKGDLLDAIFYQRRKAGNLKYKLRGMMGRFGNMDYISPAVYPEEIRNIEAGEWIEFIENIRDHMDVDVLILDMGDTVAGLTKIMEMCSVIYMPQRPDFFSQGKIMQFEEYLRNVSEEALLGKIKKVELPETGAFTGPEEYMDTLTGGTFAGAVRGLCVEECGGAYGK